MSEQRRPIIVAHRGLHHVHPENSLAAFRAAWEACVEWCECDVQQARDGELVVIHDATLDRTTTGTGPVTSFDAVELRRLRLKAPSGLPTDKHLPTLAELVDVMPFGAGLLLEIKPRLSHDRLRAHFVGVEDRRVVVQSFHREVVEALRGIVQETAWLTDKPLDLRELPACKSINIRHDRLSADALASLRDSRYSVGVWTPNSDADLLRAIDLGVDMIITDEPLRARELLDRRG
jgi:glycerophosphoryl diester phosphodiesterase